MIQCIIQITLHGNTYPFQMHEYHKDQKITTFIRDTSSIRTLVPMLTMSTLSWTYGSIKLYILQLNKCHKPQKLLALQSSNRPFPSNQAPQRTKLNRGLDRIPRAHGDLMHSKYTLSGLICPRYVYFIIGCVIPMYVSVPRHSS